MEEKFEEEDNFAVFSLKFGRVVLPEVLQKLEGRARVCDVII